MAGILSSILHHFINGVEIESIDEKINYREVILLLTTISYAEDNVNSIVSQTKKDIKLFNFITTLNRKIY